MSNKGFSVRRATDGSMLPPVKKLVQSYLMKKEGKWITSTELRVKLGLGQRAVHWAASELTEEGELESRHIGHRQPVQYRYISS